MRPLVELFRAQAIVPHPASHGLLRARSGARVFCDLGADIDALWLSR